MFINIMKWICAIAAGTAAIRISTIARNETGKSQWFASFVDIFDYIQITQRRDGRIGIWFWVFMASFTLLLSLILLPALR